MPPDLRLRTVYLVELVGPPDRSVVLAKEGLRGRIEFIASDAIASARVSGRRTFSNVSSNSRFKSPDVIPADEQVGECCYETAREFSATRSFPTMRIFDVGEGRMEAGLPGPWSSSFANCCAPSFRSAHAGSPEH